MGANFCHSYNSNGRNIDGDRTAITARIETSILKDDNSFDWVHSEEEVDYIVKVDNEYIPLVLPSDGSIFKKAAVRIGG